MCSFHSHRADKVIGLELNAEEAVAVHVQGAIDAVLQQQQQAAGTPPSMVITDSAQAGVMANNFFVHWSEVM